MIDWNGFPNAGKVHTDSPAHRLMWLVDSEVNLLKQTVLKAAQLEMHRLQFTWLIPIFANSDFLSKNYNWQHIQTKIYTFLMQNY